MSTFDNDELRRIAQTDDLPITPEREDGRTYGIPYLDPMLGRGPRAATVKIVPRDGAG